MTIIDFGRWSMSDGLVLFSNESKFDRRTLEGIRLTVTSIKARWTSKISKNGNLYVAVESFFVIKAYPTVTVNNGSNGLEVRGLYGEIWSEICDALKIDYVVIEESKYGAATSNGSSTFNGMIGKVQRNEADIAVADFLKTLSRSEVVDFASQLYFVRFVLLRTSD